MNKTKKNLKLIYMTLVAIMLVSYTWTPLVSAQSISSQDKSRLGIEVGNAIKELEDIKNIEIKNEKETTEKKEFVLVLDDEESLVTYDKINEELYVDGELAITDLVIEEEIEGAGELEELTLMKASKVKSYTIGNSLGIWKWTNTNYKTGEFNVVTVTVAAIVGTISLILTKKPTYSAISAAAGGLLSSLVQIDQYKVYWSMYRYKAKDRPKAYYQDNVHFYNYKGRSANNKIMTLTHYWGNL